MAPAHDRDPFAENVLRETIDDALLFPLAYREYLRYRELVSKAQLLSLQTARLAALIRHATRSVPVYRGVDLQSAGPHANLMSLLSRFRPVTKADLRTNFIDHCDDQFDPADCRIVSTSGTTGEPLRVLRSRDGIAHAAALAMTRRERWGIGFGRKSLTPCHGRLREWFEYTSPLQALGRVALFGTSKDERREQEMVARSVAFEPDMLTGLPSYCTQFAGMLSRHRKRLTTVSAVATSGAHLEPCDRANLRDAFEAPVYNMYGLKEVSTVAADCNLGSLHLESERILVEVLDDDDQPVPEGTAGEVVVTDLVNFAMPIIRYRTGDVGYIDTKGCRCELPTKTLQIVEGRRYPKISLPGGHQLDLARLLGPIRYQSIRRFQVVRVADASFDVIVQSQNESSRTALHDAMDEVCRELAGQLELRVRFVNDAAEFAYSRDGKPREFLDSRHMLPTTEA